MPSSRMPSGRMPSGRMPSGRKPSGRKPSGRKRERISREQEEWAGRLLLAEAERVDIDLDALLTRVMSEANISVRGRASARDRASVRGGATARRKDARTGGRAASNPRPRFVPAVVAAAVLVILAVVGSVVPGLRFWGGGAREGVAQVEGPVPGGGSRSSAPTASLGAEPPSLSVSAPPPDLVAGPAQDGSAQDGKLPSRFQWKSSGALISAKPDAAHRISGIEDPSVVYYNDAWHVFATAVGGSTESLVYLSFTDWAKAGAAKQYYLDRSAIGTGHRAAPEVFYFAPQKLWYLVYETGNASYSTNPDIADPAGWSAPKNFYNGMPGIVRTNIGGGYWIDMWVICDTVNCYLFSSDDNGHLYRSQTPLADFPNGMSQPAMVLSDTNSFNVYDASSVYQVAGTDQYLLLVQAIGSDGRDYFQSWTSSSIAGSWTKLAASQSNPFARMSNVTLSGTPWTRDISQGELIRSGYDQTLRINPCDLHYLYLGTSQQLGMLTLTGSPCS